MPQLEFHHVNRRLQKKNNSKFSTSWKQILLSLWLPKITHEILSFYSKQIRKERSLSARAGENEILNELREGKDPILTLP